MAKATLTSPMAVNPQQATDIVIRSAQVDFSGRTISVYYELRGASGETLDARNVVLDSAAVKTWIDNQEATIYTRLLSKLGITGTVG